jgi:hypothetical protein
MELAELEKKREFRIAEADMLDRVEDRSTIYDTKRRQGDARDRLMFEDAIREIFETAGRPLRLKEIRENLEKYDYTWNNYQQARYHIVSLESIQSAGAFGFYQYLRSL